MSEESLVRRERDNVARVGETEIQSVEFTPRSGLNPDLVSEDAMRLRREPGMPRMR